MDAHLRDMSFVLLVVLALIGMGIAAGFNGISPATALLLLAGTLLGQLFQREFQLDWKESVLAAATGLFLGIGLLGWASARLLLVPFSVFLVASPFLTRGRAYIFGNQRSTITN